MSFKAQILYLIVAFILINAPIVSISASSQISKCKAVFKKPKPITAYNQTDYLKLLFPTDHKIQKLITYYELDTTHRGIYYTIIVNIFSKENENFLKQTIHSYPELLEFKTEKGQKNLLHLAVINNNLEIVQFLSAFSALINHKDTTGATPLLLSITGTDNLNIFKFLLSHPLRDVSVRDELGDNIFHYIFFTQNQQGKQETILDLLLEHLDDNTISKLVNSGNNEGETPFNYLVRDFNITIAKKLISKTTIDFAQTTKEGNNLMHIASLLDNKSARTFLLNHSTSINIRQKNKQGLTPLQILSSHRKNRPIM